MIKKKLLDSFAEALLIIKTKDNMLDFLYGVLTPKEIAEIPTRLEIVKQLKAGVPQQQIAKGLGVGVATVTRGSKEIQKGRFSQVK